MMQIKKLSLLLLMAAGIIFFTQCLDPGNNKDPRGKAFAGSEACLTCHKEIYGSYLHTAHFHSASLASAATIEGSFSKDSNIFVVNDTTKIMMEKRDNDFYQVLYENGKEKRAERFDIVFGYTKGQAYLYWKKSLLFQLPVSYFTALHDWTSSPGYPEGKVFFDRPVFKRCFECHSSFIKQSGVYEVKALDKNSVIYNIDCERCHGPAASHVKFHTEYPSEKEGKYIISFKNFTRSQKIDMCAVCHSGNNNIMLASTFAFLPGDSLSQFMIVNKNIPPSGKPDVHGNQPQLLELSKCFRASNMDCSTCHNTHVNDRGNYAQYAERCQTCHSEANHNFCKMADSLDRSFVRNNCTKCHMPEQSSNIIKGKTSDEGMQTAVQMVNHRIAIYPEESQKIISLLQKENGTSKK
ncbi:MAG: hypothetical protein JST96_09830 [Bacteroidetes bacterium]|nr:hypothetical protein [Bacteroidota bacterium]